MNTKRQKGVTVTCADSVMRTATIQVLWQSDKPMGQSGRQASRPVNKQAGRQYTSKHTLDYGAWLHLAASQHRP